MKNLLKGALLVGAAVGIGLEIAKKLNKKEQEVKEEVEEEVEITAENIDELIEKEKRDYEEKMAEMKKRHEKTRKKNRIVEKVSKTVINVVEIAIIAIFATAYNENASLIMANASDYSDAYKDNYILCFTIVGGLLGKAICVVIKKSCEALVDFKYYLIENVRGDQDE